MSGRNDFCKPAYATKGLKSPSGMAKAGYARVDMEEIDVEVDNLALAKISGGEGGAGFFNRLVFWWVNPAITEGSKLENVEVEQLWPLAGTEQLLHLQENLYAAWLCVTGNSSREEMAVDAAVAASGQGASMWNMPLARAYWQVHKEKYLFCCFIKYLNDFIQIAPPILLNQILKFLTSEDESDNWSGYGYVLLMFASMNIKTIIENQYFFHMTRIALQCNVATKGMVYRKSLRLTVEAKSHHTEGAMVNMMQQMQNGGGV